MKNMRATLIGLSLFVAASLPLSARADTACIARYSSAFASLEGKVWQAGTQAGADAAVEELFGPRPQSCEDGAYDYFLSRFEEFASLGVRRGSPKNKKDFTENLMRLAVAAIRKGPINRSAKDAKSGQFNIRQVRAHIDPRVEEYGNTPLMQSLLGAIGNTLDPQVIAEAAPIPPGGNPNNITQIRIPLQPMPSWAIVHLYEMREVAKNTSADPALQIKLQAIINWVEQTTQTSP